MTATTGRTPDEAVDHALGLVVGEDTWDCAAMAYDEARRLNRPHRDAIRCALIAAQMAVAEMLNPNEPENAHAE
ncbi:hypothetical protein [Falsiroseomonas tokyonensis]|uniref:Uncharacterized protein n=1 Tax=Falsiroseomonas tokyonensis TaxID=430521 RepID=A0ABV7C2A5_9PROT|nr:hypothetical protein [Falsiroseomonas tokyonensis]MBU8540792.1 hypothetical protein [Falsiroseomonas tokyonensis]